MKRDFDQPTGITAQHTFLCSSCGKRAAKVKVLPGEILIWSVGHLGGSISAGDRQRVVTAIVAGDARALYAVNPEFAPFFCPLCGNCYCEEHWEQRERFEEGGWFDCVEGTCPRGHKRILED